MPGNLQLLTSTTIPIYHEILLFELQKSTHCVKTFDPTGLSLTNIDLDHVPPLIVCTGLWISPDMLHNYHESHQFLGPCCLCLLFAPVRKEPTFTEAAIYIPVTGCYQGEYVAECAKSWCSYLGQSPFHLA
ncbi:hypothetical protein L208DRAFT_1267589 [Tricholoma matsutake]|nr:hypothetical protein L208DRAFT_1267589 [Tricholoma matsutake 945]